MIPTQRFGFIGVSATRSSINAVFPRWAEVLGLGAVAFDPVDLPIDADAASYRAVVARIRDDPSHRGALVTSHKVRLLEAAGDLFDVLDHYAQTCGEISCISKRDRRLVGHAKDPITAGRALDDFVPRGHFARTGAHVLCLGAGGAGLAIGVHLRSRQDPDDRPGHLVLVDRAPERLEVVRDVLERVGSPPPTVELCCGGPPSEHDRLLGALPPASLVINATGMGKDRPGSPLTDRASFPRGAYVWELNYRGARRFLEQARAQAATRELTIEDGWRYFIHGWSEVIAEAFGLDLDASLLDRLAQAAAEVRT